MEGGEDGWLVADDVGWGIVSRVDDVPPYSLCIAILMYANSDTMKSRRLGGEEGGGGGSSVPCLPACLPVPLPANSVAPWRDPFSA